jgi:hypothetical protein
MTRLPTLIVCALALVPAPSAAVAADAPAPTWVRSGGGPAADDADGLSADRFGNVNVSGAFRRTATVAPGRLLTSAGGDDVFSVQYDASGAVRWVRRFGAEGTDHVYDSAADRAGNVVLSGTFAGRVAFDATTLTSAGGTPVYGDAFLAKLGRGGAVRWARRFGGPAPDGGNEVATDRSGAVLAVGDTGGAVDLGGGRRLPHRGGRDSFVLRLTPGGALDWAVPVAGAGDQQGRAVASDRDGDVLVAGQYTGPSRVGRRSLPPSAGRSNLFLARLSPAGRVRWARGFGAAGADAARGIAPDGAGGVIFTGQFTGELAFDGHRVRSRGASDVFIARADASGRVRWARSFGGPGVERGMEVEVGSRGIYVAGSFSGTALLGDRTLAAHGVRDAFFARLDRRGRVCRLVQPASGVFVTGDEVALAGGRVSFLGRFAGTTALGPTALTSAGATDWLALHFRDLGAGPCR